MQFHPQPNAQKYNVEYQRNTTLMNMLRFHFNADLDCFPSKKSFIKKDLKFKEFVFNNNNGIPRDLQPIGPDATTSVPIREYHETPQTG